MSGMQILINNEHDGYENIEFTKLIEKGFYALADLENLEPDWEVSVSFVNDAAIRALNHQYRGQDEPTDVLSFPQDDLPPGLPPILGDIVISLDRAVEQAAEYGHELKREVLYLAIHGFLHLIGYDHQTEAERAVMRDREEKVLAGLCLGR